MKNLAIIPARGGSKRIPKKNIVDFFGKPLIAYPIKVALNTHLFDDVIVSTDDKEIARISSEFGATVPFLRSEANSNDHATLNDVFIEVREWYRKKQIVFDHYCLILPNSPLINEGLLKQGYDLLINSHFDSIRPIVRFQYPIQRAYSFKDGKVAFMNPEYARTRSQDLEPAYHDAGMFYFIREGCDLTGTNKGAFEIESLYAQEIDNPDDLRIAEMKFKFLNNIK